MVSGLVAGVLTLGAAGGVEVRGGQSLPRAPLASADPAALGPAAWPAVLRQAETGRPRTARLTVTVPQADAELLVDGQPVDITGLVREVSVASPLLEATEHVLVVRWRPNNYTVMSRRGRVRVAGGAVAAVDLSRATGGDGAEIRYVATPFHVVTEMIAMAGITPADVVFEPGCGDARLTIAAVKAGARRGVGIDLDPERVADSRGRVVAAGLDHRIEIRQGDALAIPDLSNATLVFLYMGDEFNRLIRPMLRKQLPVGARVVSHRFTMGDWAPDKTVSLPDEGGNTDLHLWTITAAVKAAEQ